MSDETIAFIFAAVGLIGGMLLLWRLVRWQSRHRFDETPDPVVPARFDPASVEGSLGKTVPPVVTYPTREQPKARKEPPSSTRTLSSRAPRSLQPTGARFPERDHEAIEIPLPLILGGTHLENQLSVNPSRDDSATDFGGGGAGGSWSDGLPSRSDRDGDPDSSSSTSSTSDSSSDSGSSDGGSGGGE